MVKRIPPGIKKFKDEILHEIVALRKDISVVSGHRDMLKNHETRIEKLEKIMV